MTFDNTKAIEDYFSPLGFRKFDYNLAPGDLKIVFQKKYKDATGIKYFLNFFVVHFFDPNSGKQVYEISFHAQFYQRKTHNAVDMEFIGWTLEDIEKWVEQLFTSGLVEYYEYF